jgi:hypothetical protein
MTKEFPNDSMTNEPARPHIRASGFFRHYGLGISHSAGSTFCALRGLIKLPGYGLAGALVPAGFGSSAASFAAMAGLPG